MSSLKSNNNLTLNNNFDEFSEFSNNNANIYNMSENFENSFYNNETSIINSDLIVFNSNFKKSKTIELFENSENRNSEKFYERNSFHNLSNNKSFIDLNFYDLKIVNNINKENKENKEFIGKKIKKGKKAEERIKKPKFIAENPLDKTIFNVGNFDNYSKKMIDEAMNLNNKKKYNRKNVTTNSKNKKRRMYRTDEIINKLMGKLFRKLINQINAKLEISKSKKKFKFLPDCYIKKFKSMILKAKKEKNLASVDFTLETIFSTEFFKIEKKIFVNNINTIKYLKESKNKTIYENSNFNIFKDMKFSQILNQFFYSKEFGMDISIFKDEQQEEDYIKEYIFKAKKLLNLFLL